MNLTPMRFGDYTWPHNPETCRMILKRKIAVQKAPFGGYCLQDLGGIHRVMQGEGVFAGKDAYEQFRALVQVFRTKPTATLVHPVWQTMRARFAELEVTEEPRPDYVRYAFEFWEEGDMKGLTVLPARTEEQMQAKPEESPKTEPQKTAEHHKVVKGETLWKIAKQYGVTLERLLELNPQIKNPNLIHPGDEVRVR